MPEILQDICDQAVLTFKNRKDPSFKQNMEHLKSLVARVTTNDVDLEVDSFKNKKNMYCMGLVSNSEIFEMAVLILPEGAKIPLHDHQNMIGMIKVLCGKIKVQSYTLMDRHTDEKGHVKANRCNPVIVTPSGKLCCLTEHERNLHEISVIEGPAAFLDILSPPYGERDCTFYKEDKSVKQNKGMPNRQEVLLKKTQEVYTPWMQQKYTGNLDVPHC